MNFNGFFPHTDCNKVVWLNESRLQTDSPEISSSESTNYNRRFVTDKDPNLNILNGHVDGTEAAYFIKLGDHYQHRDSGEKSYGNGQSIACSTKRNAVHHMKGDQQAKKHRLDIGTMTAGAKCIYPNRKFDSKNSMKYERNKSDNPNSVWQKQQNAMKNALMAAHNDNFMVEYEEEEEEMDIEEDEKLSRYIERGEDPTHVSSSYAPDDSIITDYDDMMGQEDTINISMMRPQQPLNLDFVPKRENENEKQYGKRRREETNFDSWWNLMSDGTALTVTDEPTNKTGRYGCSYGNCCSKYRSNNKADVKNHFSVHTGNGRYPCHYCPKWKTASNRKRHHQTHTKLPTYQCLVCESKYADEKSVLNHMRGNHIKEGQCQCDSLPEYAKLEPVNGVHLRKMNMPCSVTIHGGAARIG